MSRYPTFPPLIDEMRSLSITTFKRHGLLQAAYRRATIEWFRRDRPNGSIGVTVWLNEQEGKGKVRFSYEIKAEQYFYNVGLEAVPCNLGGGQRWYFICSQTGKRCTKLHFANGYLQHRSGIPGAMYSRQTESVKTRMIHWLVEGTFESHKPDLPKPYYQGKPTKRLLRHRKICQRVIPWLLKTGDLDAKELEEMDLAKLDW